MQDTKTIIMIDILKEGDIVKLEGIDYIIIEAGPAKELNPPGVEYFYRYTLKVKYLN